MCIYRGNDPSNKTDLIWATETAGKQKGVNPDWVASKGKYGRNYMKTGETLSADEWIGSNDGSIMLMMQKDVGYLNGLPVTQETSEFLSPFVTGITSCNV